MIIECISCNKKFNVDSDLIHPSGRTLQCGSCNHVWFFDKKKIDHNIKEKKIEKSNVSPEINNKKNLKKKLSKTNTDHGSSKINEIIKYEPRTSFTLGKFLSYILVFIISLVSLFILIDTFKLPLFNYFPHLEFLLYNFYETLTDIELFIKDLI